MGNTRRAVDDVTITIALCLIEFELLPLPWVTSPCDKKGRVDARIRGPSKAGSEKALVVLHGGLSKGEVGSVKKVSLFALVGCVLLFGDIILL